MSNGHRLTEIPSDINERSRYEQASYFREQGCIIHPLYSPKANVLSPGKQPMLNMEERIFYGGENRLPGFKCHDDHCVGRWIKAGRIPSIQVGPQTIRITDRELNPILREHHGPR
jgi:hypothetical protein